MRIEYVRNLMASHMVLEERMALEDWEREMIVHSQIKEILFGETVIENTTRSLWYDITGKQALDVWLETRALHYELLCGLLTGLYDAIGQLESFLLQPDAILLLPETIFLDHEAEEVCFCYYPGNGTGGGLPQTFRELLEYLLAKIDHRDERAVELGYQVYEQAGKDGFGLAALRELLHMEYEREEVQASKEDAIVEGGAIEVEMSEYAMGESEKLTSKKNSQIRKAVQEEKTSQKKIDVLLMKITSEIKKLLFKNIEEWKRGAHREEQPEEFVFEPEEQTKEERSRPTVLLSDLSREPEGILRYEGTDSFRDIKLEHFPFIIGSAPDCDGCIKKDTVSRHHARITRVEDIYFVEDLNSSNGTYVGGELLNYKVKMSLQKNEVILFAEEKFRFI